MQLVDEHIDRTVQPHQHAAESTKTINDLVCAVAAAAEMEKDFAFTKPTVLGWLQRNLHMQISIGRLVPRANRRHRRG